MFLALNERWLKVVVGVALAVLLLVSCGAVVFGKEAITLRVSTWLADPSERDFYERWAKEYMVEHPDIKVIVDIPADYFSKITVGTAASYVADLIRVPGDMLPTWADQGIVMPLTQKWLKEADMDDLQPIAIVCGTYKGKFYGWDTHMSGQTLHYDRTAFDDAGLLYPDASWTWDDMAKAAKKLVRLDNKGQPQRYGVAWYYIGDLRGAWQQHVWTLGGEVFDEVNRPLFPSRETLIALDFMYDLTTRQNVAPRVFDDPRALFHQGKTAMLLDGIWMNPYFSTSDKVEHATAVVPHDRERACAAAPCLWAISSQTRHPQEAWELYRFWVGRKNGLEFTDFGGKKAYGVPLWKSALTDPKFRPVPTLRPLIEMLRYMRRPYVFTGIDKFWNMANPLLRDAVLGSKSSMNALTELRQQTETLLKK